MFNSIFYLILLAKIKSSAKIACKVAGHSAKSINLCASTLWTGLTKFTLVTTICTKCGYEGELGESCPQCGSTKMQRLRRVSG